MNTTQPDNACFQCGHPLHTHNHHTAHVVYVVLACLGCYKRVRGTTIPGGGLGVGKHLDPVTNQTCYGSDLPGQYLDTIVWPVQVEDKQDKQPDDPATMKEAWECLKQHIGPKQ